MPATHNVDGMIAQRRALSDWLRALPVEAWNDEVRRVVDRLCRLYVEAVDGELAVAVPDDRGEAAAVLDRIAGAAELSFAEAADDRWDLPREEFRAEGGTTEMGIAGVMASLHIAAVELGRVTGRAVAIPDDAREAAIAAVVWRASGTNEAPVRIVVGNGEEYMVGPGEPEATLYTDHEAVLAVACGWRDPAALAAEGRWRFEGPEEAQEAFERTFRFARETHG